MFTECFGKILSEFALFVFLIFLRVNVCLEFYFKESIKNLS